MKNRTKYVWECIACRKRNIDTWRHQFDMSRTYSVDMECQKCGKQNRLHFSFYVELTPHERRAE